MTGTNLAFAHAAFSAMNHVNGAPFKGDELTYVMLAALNVIRRGVKAKQVILPDCEYANCYNSAYAASLCVLYDPGWRQRRWR